jgi:Family of unknown function (DUF5995)
MMARAAKVPPAGIVDEVADRIVGYLKRYDAAHDSRAVFAYVYLKLTRTLADALRRGDPKFDDPSWVAELSRSLAAEYFAAADRMDTWLTASGTRADQVVTADDLPDTIPEPWRDVYAAISGGRSYVLEDALFSMMAHISYDLPTALRRMSEVVDIAGHVADYHRMNDVLGSAVDGVQDDLANRYSRWLADLDRLFARDDELFSNYGIRLSRGMAWYNFTRLCDAHASAEAERSIRTSTLAFIREVREPDDPVLRLAVRVGRLVIPERRQWPSPDANP